MSASKEPENDERPVAALPNIGPEYARYAGLGIQFAGTVCLLVLGGYWLDQRIGTLPWLTALGALTGCIGGMISLVKKVPPPSGKPRPKSPPAPPKK